MAWRPYNNLIKGELDNSTPGKVKGWIKFVGLKETVKLNLKGDFEGNIKGDIIQLANPNPHDRNTELNRPGSYMERFNPIQTGSAGIIKLNAHGLYIEWFSEQNGRVVLELNYSKVEITKPPSK